MHGKRKHLKHLRVVREFLTRDGLFMASLDLHEYLLKHPRWHTRDELAERWGVWPQTVSYWAAPLLRDGYIERRDAPGNIAEGGRLPSTYRATRKRTTPLRRKYERMAEKAARELDRISRRTR